MSSPRYEYEYVALKAETIPELLYRTKFRERQLWKMLQESWADNKIVLFMFETYPHPHLRDIVSQDVRGMIA